VILDDKIFEKKCEFILELAKVSHETGIQSRRLEQYLKKVTLSFGFEGDFLVTPSKIESHFSKPGEIFQRSKTIHSRAGDFSLRKIDELDELVRTILSGKMSLDKAHNKLAKIRISADKADKAPSNMITSLGYFLSSAGFAGFLRCSVFDIVLSGLLGIFVFFLNKFMTRWFQRFDVMGLFFPPFFVAIILSLISLLHANIEFYFVLLSATIYLIPGFSISIGLIEVFYGYTLSGLENFLNGLTRLLILFSGAFCGFFLMKTHVFINISSSISAIWVWPSAVVLAIGLALIFDTPRSIFFWVILGVLISVLGILLGTSIMGPNFGNLLGSFFAILFGNIWSSKTKKPMSLILLPTFIFLVSGSIGFRGLVLLSQNQFSIGIQEVSHMFIVALSIGIGMCLANGVYRSNQEI
jgi:uncharacterized membrane protein YjjP (DUF1212 family)